MGRRSYGREKVDERDGEEDWYGMGRRTGMGWGGGLVWDGEEDWYGMSVLTNFIRVNH